jgi:perosamine synthetase
MIEKSPLGDLYNKSVVKPELSIIDANKILENANLDMLFVLDGKKLVGCLTAGDIRRSLIAGTSSANAVTKAMKTDFSFVTLDSSPTEIHNSFTAGVNLVPVLDNYGNLIDLLKRDSHTFIPLSEPNIGPLEKQLVNETLDSNWISSTGNFVSEFETRFGEYIGSPNCVTVSNGTVGLVLALKALGVGYGDEVIVPSLTFGATANAVLQVGARPIFVDVDCETWCLDNRLIESSITQHTKAIMPVHLYGHSADIDGLKEVIGSRNILIIEDAAEAIGTKYKGQLVGSMCDAAVFSFFANKTITTGEGGMVAFKSSEIATKARRMRSHGFSPERRYEHDIWGTNFRLTNMQAALGVAQLERVDSLIEKKKLIAKWYQNTFDQLGIEGVDLPPNMGWNESTFWLYTILLPNAIKPAELVAYLQLNRIESRRVFAPLHRQEYFLNYSSEKDFSNTENIYGRGISLPSSTNLEKKHIEKVCYAIHEFITK